MRAPSSTLLLISSLSLAHGFFGHAAAKPIRPPVVARAPVAAPPPKMTVGKEPAEPLARRGPRFALPKLPTHMALPAASYAGLAGVAAGTVRLLSPIVSWQGYALVGWCVGMPVVLALGQLALLGGEGVAKAMGGAKSDDPRLQKLASDAAAAVGVSAPTVYELKSKEPNAFAASGVTGGSTTVAVTSGLREILSEQELGAVLAHEMGHLRNSDVVRNMHIAAAAAGFGGVYETGRFLLESSSRKSRRKKKDDEGGGAGVGLALMAGGVALQGAAHLLRLSASRGAELRADRAAAEAFGAENLISALRKIDRQAARRPADLRESTVGRAYAFAMISDGPTSRPRKLGWLERIGRALRTHPPIDERVAALETAAADGLVPKRAPSQSAWW